MNDSFSSYAMSLLERFQHNLQRSALVCGGERVVVAVSGGPDSLCLLHLLWRLREPLDLRLHVAHLDHAFRGEQSAAEARFVAAFAEQLGLPATVERRDANALMGDTTTNKLAAARMVRYAFLAEVAQREGADVVAVAHQADDQAETVLMHLLRGAGPAGLRGIRQRVPWSEWTSNLPTNDGVKADLIRPLLDISRELIEAYCAEQQLDPRHDPSNRATIYTRSRVRLDLLPRLKEYNSHISSALAHTALICGDDYDFIQRELDTRWPALARSEPDCVTFARKVWNDLHPALQRYALRRALEQLAPATEVSFAQIEALRAFLIDGRGLRPNLPGTIRFAVSPNSVMFTMHDSDATPDEPQIAGACHVTVPGSVDLAGWQLNSATAQPEGWIHDRWHVVLDGERLNGTLTLRGRQNGDRFWPAGGVGSKRLQDFFVDNKLPRTLRDRWPLVTCGDDLVWIVGLRADERFVQRTTTRNHIWLWVESNREQRSS